MVKSNFSMEYVVCVDWVLVSGTVFSFELNDSFLDARPPSFTMVVVTFAVWRVALVGAGMPSKLVGLHDVNSGALRGHTIPVGVPAASLVINLGQVDTGGAGAGNFTDIDIEVE